MIAAPAGGVEPATGALRLHRVGKSFAAGSVAALDEVTLELPRGSFTTLFGPSGCGKSTLLRILAGLLTADRGEVDVFGQTPRQAVREKNIGWIPQSPALLPWASVRANATLATSLNRRADRRRLSKRVPGDPEAILAEVGLSAVAQRRPAALSGGMQQRVAIARAFVHGAPLLLMDEPFSAVDDLTRSRLREFLLDLWHRHRTTVVFVTHSATEAVLLSDRVVVMSPSPGRVLASIEVALPRKPGERDIDSAEFRALVAAVRAELRRGGPGDDVPA